MGSDEIDVKNKKDSEKLLKTVSENSVNFVFGCDVVPRLYGHTNYVNKVINKVVPEIVKDKVTLSRFLGGGLLRGMVTEKFFEVLKATLLPLITVAAKYRHIGKLVYYDGDNEDEPRVMTDTGPSKEGSDDRTHLSSIQFDTYKFKEGKCAETLLDAHSHFPTAFAAYIAEAVKE